MSELELESRSTPGQLLKSARERAGLSLETIAEQLKMTVTKIRALEDDNYQPFPADTYLKGYLRNYARMVSFSEEKTIESYEAFVAGCNQKSLNENIARVAAESKANTKKTILAFLLLVLLAIFAAYYYFGEQSASTNHSSDGSSVSVDNSNPDEGSQSLKSEIAVRASTSAELPSAQPVMPSAKQVRQPGLLAAELESLANDKAAATVSNATAKTAQAKVIEPSQSGYVFSFTGKCWLEVVDSRGKKIISKEYKAGDSVSLEGQGPFKVLLGNAPAASLVHNNEAVTITPDKNRKLLRITLNQ